MKKLIQLSFLVFTTCLFANVDSSKDRQESVNFSITECCKQTASNGVVGAGRLSVTITKCVTVENTDNAAAVKLHACNTALAAAQNALKTISDAQFIIH
jgi:hypothetical protein